MQQVSIYTHCNLSASANWQVMSILQYPFILMWSGLVMSANETSGSFGPMCGKALHIAECHRKRSTVAATEHEAIMSRYALRQRMATGKRAGVKFVAFSQVPVRQVRSANRKLVECIHV